MSLDEKFADAATRVKGLNNRPSNTDLLELYALFKQGSAGDVQGKRPGMMDFTGRAKYDAWAAKKGMASTIAKQQYVDLVEKLLATNR